MRSWVSLALGIALSGWMAGAQAHAHLRGAVPADGSVVATAPSRIVLDFSEPARLTAAWLSRDGGAKRKLGSLPSASAAQVAVPMPALTPGRYELTWRALSADGHVVPGHIRFTVSARGGAARR